MLSFTMFCLSRISINGTIQYEVFVFDFYLARVFKTYVVYINTLFFYIAEWYSIVLIMLPYFSPSVDEK